MLLRVLSLNTWGLPCGLARSTARRMRAIGGRLPEFGADVVGLQEVWSADSRRTLVEAGRSAGYDAIWHRPRSLGASGLLVLSRLPIRSADFTRYRLAGLPQRIGHADYYGGKGFVILTLESEAGPLALLDTHLHASYVSGDEPDEYLGIRIAQAIELAAALRRVELPTVALGDFNMQEGSPEYDSLLGLSGLVDAAVALDRRQATCLAPHPYRADDAPAERIDLVLSRPGRERSATARDLRRVLDEPLEIGDHTGAHSDHAGLLAEIEIAPRRDPLAGGVRIHEPDPSVVDATARQLLASRKLALARRGGERRWAAGGAAASLLGLASARRASRSRRSVLSALLLAASSLGLVASGAMALLSEIATPDELRGYDEVAELLSTWRDQAR